MESRYQNLYKLPNNLYKEGSPLIIEAGALLKDIVSNNVLVHLKLLNIFNKAVIACKVCITAYEPNGNMVEGIENFQYLDINILQGEEFGSKTPIELPVKTTRLFDVNVSEVVFADGTIWRSQVPDALEVDCKREKWNPLPLQKSINQGIKDTTLVEQFKVEVGKNAEYCPELYMGLFRCSCGTNNLSVFRKCYKCNKTYEELISFMDEDYLGLKYKERIKREHEEHEAKTKELRKAEEEIQRNRIAHKKKVKRNCAIIIAVILTFFFLYMTIWHLIPFIRYQNAMKEMESGAYDDAYNTFIALGEFDDSKEQAIITLYKKANSLESIKSYREAAEVYRTILDYENSTEKMEYCLNEANYLDAIEKCDLGDYDGAIKIFEELGEYADSEERIRKTIYIHACTCYDDGDYEEALNLFDTVKDYSDSADLIIRTKYDFASKMYDEKKYEQAFTMFESIKNYKDASIRMMESEYAFAEELFQNKDYKNAYMNYNNIDINDSKMKAKLSLYKYALSMEEEKNYKEASLFFGYDILKGYEDSEERYAKVTYLYAKEGYDAGKYDVAYDYFMRIPNYSDSDTMALESGYKFGIQSIDKKKYDQAIRVFKELGKYKDSQTKLNIAKYGYVTAHKTIDDKNTYEYLNELKDVGYKDSDKLYKELYSWKVTLCAVNSRSNDYKTISKEVNRNDYCHFQFRLTGGIPGEKISLKHTVIWPNGEKKNADWYWEDVKVGDSFGLEWSSGLNYSGSKGTLQIKVYNKKTGELIGNGSVEVY